MFCLLPNTWNTKTSRKTNKFITAMVKISKSFTKATSTIKIISPTKKQTIFIKKTSSLIIVVRRTNLRKLLIKRGEPVSIKLAMLWVVDPNRSVSGKKIIHQLLASSKIQTRIIKKAKIQWTLNPSTVSNYPNLKTPMLQSPNTRKNSSIVGTLVISTLSQET